MNSRTCLKRLFAICIAFMFIYLLLAIKHFNFKNLPRIQIPFALISNTTQQNATKETNVDFKVEFSIIYDTTTKTVTNIDQTTKQQSCDIIHKDYNQYYHDFDGVKYPQYLYLSQNYSINFDCLNNSSPMKQILVWTKFYGGADFGYGIGKVKPFKDHNCPVTNCELTNDKDRVNQSDFVLVWLTDNLEKEIPKMRPEKQRWVAGVIESPIHTPSYTRFNGVFNLTADYQIESEFGINYESQKRFLWGLNATFDESHDFSQGKTGFIGALISNCNAWHNKRLEYINNLRKYVDVTIHGRCGIECPKEVDCREMVGAKYKFYFAFENSNCKDYITEKFFQLLKYDTVMVVFGAGNYSRYVSV